MFGMEYPIIEINHSDETENLGTKEKFWFFDEKTKIKNLFKIGKCIGENWAEKVSCELAKLIGLPCADYEFAKYKDRIGVVTPSFVPDNHTLIHGNELLARYIKNYPTAQFYEVKEYKLRTVLNTIERMQDIFSILGNMGLNLPMDYVANDLIEKPIDVFIGYLLFDSWIANPDRHHENWGLILNNISSLMYLSPTYDHASCLGCHITDRERENRMNTRDTQYNVASYVKRSKSAFFSKKRQKFSTLEAFKYSLKWSKPSAEYFALMIKNLSDESILSVFNKVPKDLISKISIDFSIAILNENKKRIMELMQI